VSDDPLGAFCVANPVALDGTASGPLAGRTFAAKDVFEIDGTRTGFGQPDWLRTHPPATRTASAVQKLLDAGWNLVGRTISDELCYSLSGENVHFGTPRNTAAPDRIPGGSSAGSASAVAGGACDLAIGTDCGGSVRIPASYCGIFGIRTTHGRVATDGVLPFAESFDVVGWFARDPTLLATAGAILLDNAADTTPPKRLIIFTKLFDRAEPAVRAATRAAIPSVAAHFANVEESSEDFADLDAWRVIFQTVQASEIWRNLGPWITATRPKFGPGIRERFAAAATVTPEAAAAARARMADIRARLREKIRPGDALCLPTAPRVAPRLNTPASDVEVSYRNAAMALLCIAGLGGLPQLTLPLATAENCPAGLSLVGPPAADEALLGLAARVSSA
jgi:amidase